MSYVPGNLDLEPFKQAVADIAAHEHPKGYDLYCHNLESWLGERARFFIAEIEHLRAMADEFERQLSELTREVEEKTRRLIELERPVSAPPGLDRRTFARPPAWGETQMQDGEHLTEATPPRPRTVWRHSCGAEADALGMYAEPCPKCGVTGPWTSAEAGITEGPEIATVVDAELNGHEPTPFAEGGGYAS